MLCENCKKEIYNASSCKYCGYDPALDNNDNPPVEYYPPEETKIVTRKKANVPSIVGLVFSILGFFFPCYIVGLVLNFIGLARIKYDHKGRLHVMLGFAFLLFWVVLNVFVIIWLVNFIISLFP
ncbi:MAG: DUF4190 domain-containing protein [Clostridia bacterium]|nr:DUF4190 domain-containing protein [Clostridia bacterium]